MREGVTGWGERRGEPRFRAKYAAIYSYISVWEHGCTVWALWQIPDIHISDHPFRGAAFLYEWRRSCWDTTSSKGCFTFVFIRPCELRERGSIGEHSRQVDAELHSGTCSLFSCQTSTDRSVPTVSAVRVWCRCVMRKTQKLWVLPHWLFSIWWNHI